MDSADRHFAGIGVSDESEAQSDSTLLCCFLLFIYVPQQHFNELPVKCYMWKSAHIHSAKFGPVSIS